MCQHAANIDLAARSPHAVHSLFLPFAIIKSVAPFTHTSSPNRAQVLRCATVAQAIRVPEGELIVRQGDKADAFFVVREGEVLVRQKGAHEVTNLPAGFVFGESALDVSGNASRQATGAT